MSSALQQVTFDEILPLLASTYEAGRLVPFIGAGMSRNKLAGWEDFVRNLEVGARLPLSDDHPEIRAQRAVAKIRNSKNENDYLDFVRRALQGENFDDPGIPAQTSALAAIYWPLTISTNYDDLFISACRKNSEIALAPTVLGRSARDCKRVMSALVSPFDREIIWHIQGFLGGFAGDCPLSSLDDPTQLSRLRSELVIGHSEYRQVANTAVHFRRCFGEVFRSRSFLFLGSSLSEDYFWNLFGEMLELCGPSSVPHFALLAKQDKVDVRFLAEQMNITVFQYDDHERLPLLLRDLKTSITQPHARISRWSVDIRGNSSLDTVPHCPLPLPKADSDWAVAIVVRPCPQGFFTIDPAQVELCAKFRDGRFDEEKHIVSLDSGIFAVRARTGDGNEHDAVGAAVMELLSQLPATCKALHLHLPSAGGTVPPVYGFIEAVRAFGNWRIGNQSPLRLIAYAGAQVRLNLTSHQIDLHELLISKLIRFWTVVNYPSPAGHEFQAVEPIRRVFYRRPEVTLREVLVEVLGDIDDDALENWSVSLCPSPEHDKPESDTQLARPTAVSLANMGLADIGVVFGSVLSLDRVTRSAQDVQSCAQVVAAGG